MLLDEWKGDSEQQCCNLPQNMAIKIDDYYYYYHDNDHRHHHHLENSAWAGIA
jgi:hypothetical protein